MSFPTTYKDIIKRIENIDPVNYAKTRNYLDGDITYLSPYISRGVLSTKQILNMLIDKGYNPFEIEKFIQELAWREYYQRTWQHLEDDMFDDIRLKYTGTKHRKIQTALLNAETGITAIDAAINDLYAFGYMHNHVRMYTASIACNIGKAYWQLPSQWMYYHLLDGDLASNTCSWQWIAGSFSVKQYYCNQENINKYTNSDQKNTFLDIGYDKLPGIEIPPALSETSSLDLKTILPANEKLVLDTSLPLVIYNSYNLDPLWKMDIKANRILLLEPSHFKQYPVSEKVIQFIIDLSKNIDGIQVFTAEINDIPDLHMYPAIFSKEHPAFNHIPGIKEERDWLFPEVTGFHNSFFSYWKKCEQHLSKLHKHTPALQRA